jgi:hypothetical protein
MLALRFIAVLFPRQVDASGYPAFKELGVAVHANDAARYQNEPLREPAQKEYSGKVREDYRNAGRKDQAVARRF